MGVSSSSRIHPFLSLEYSVKQHKRVSRRPMFGLARDREDAAAPTR
jgi:hypothetical protein